MKTSTPKSTTVAKAKPGRYVPTTSPATNSAIEHYREMRAAADKPVLRIQ